ncbi:hypothetical protein RPB_3742 [Rhodopseudomonas palustris HaA2]|uniref:Uncharacterized protein n=1 Tax=Rhodopseudomonas palustris (strain HaA2) TaxID=316058 RepID=Q2ITM4_RHOP2|nr:hypothetical protein RPB_3742 [Rhodopseudomonas palustris HaA2]
MIHNNVELHRSCIIGQMWTPIGSDSYDERLDLAVIVDGRIEWMAGPCWRVVGGWVDCASYEFVARMPTHWRQSKAEPGSGRPAPPIDPDRALTAPKGEP